MADYVEKVGGTHLILQNTSITMFADKLGPIVWPIAPRFLQHTHFCQAPLITTFLLPKRFLFVRVSLILFVYSEFRGAFGFKLSASEMRNSPDTLGHSWSPAK